MYVGASVMVWGEISYEGRTDVRDKRRTTDCIKVSR